MHPTPWHFWPVLALGFLWHLVGVIDYTATQYEIDVWMAMATPRQGDFIDTMPDWIDGAWAIAVWGGLAGVILAALRASFSPLVLGISMLATLVLTAWITLWSYPDVVQISGVTGLLVLLGASLIAILLWLYARAMHKAGVIA